MEDRHGAAPALSSPVTLSGPPFQSVWPGQGFQCPEIEGFRGWKIAWSGPRLFRLFCLLRLMPAIAGQRFLFLLLRCAIAAPPPLSQRAR